MISDFVFATQIIQFVFLNQKFQASSFSVAIRKILVVFSCGLYIVTGNEVWTRGYGAADLSEGRSVDGQTAFNVASVTKSFTATLLGILLNETGYDLFFCVA